MKKLLVLMLLAGITYSANAQYNHALGFRGGFFSGLTYKTFLSDNMAGEAILHTRYNGWKLTGLAEWHGPAFEVEGLNWYYGAGGHLGIFQPDDRNPFWDDADEGSKVVIGVDGILGIEYNIKTIPINVSLDWKPALNLIGYAGFAADGGAFSVRYIFN